MPTHEKVKVRWAIEILTDDDMNAVARTGVWHIEQSKWNETTPKQRRVMLDEWLRDEWNSYIDSWYNETLVGLPGGTAGDGGTAHER